MFVGTDRDADAGRVVGRSWVKYYSVPSVTQEGCQKSRCPGNFPHDSLWAQTAVELPANQ